MTRTELIEKAKKILGIDITDVGGRCMYYAEETRTWYWVSLSDMRHALLLGRECESDIYSRWCAEVYQREVSRKSRRDYLGCD